MLAAYLLTSPNPSVNVRKETRMAKQKAQGQCLHGNEVGQMPPRFQKSEQVQEDLWQPQSLPGVSSCAKGSSRRLKNQEHQGQRRGHLKGSTRPVSRSGKGFVPQRQVSRGGLRTVCRGQMAYGLSRQESNAPSGGHVPP